MKELISGMQEVCQSKDASDIEDLNIYKLRGYLDAMNDMLADVDKILYSDSDNGIISINSPNRVRASLLRYFEEKGQFIKELSHTVQSFKV